MPQVWIEIEENDNCGYFPLQTFEQQSEAETYSSVIVEDVSGAPGPHEVVGWTAGDGGGRCPVTVMLIGDSGAGQSRLILGGDAGVRLRPAGSAEAWAIGAPGQAGEPYILVPRDAPVRPVSD